MFGSPATVGDELYVIKRLRCLTNYPYHMEGRFEGGLNSLQISFLRIYTHIVVGSIDE